MWDSKFHPQKHKFGPFPLWKLVALKDEAILMCSVPKVWIKENKLPLVHPPSGEKVVFINSRGKYLVSQIVPLCAHIFIATQQLSVFFFLLAAVKYRDGGCVPSLIT